MVCDNRRDIGRRTSGCRVADDKQLQGAAWRETPVRKPEGLGLRLTFRFQMQLYFCKKQKSLKFVQSRKQILVIFVQGCKQHHAPVHAYNYIKNSISSLGVMHSKLASGYAVVN